MNGAWNTKSRVYEQGEALPTIVISRSPLPSYRHDLNEGDNTRSSSHHVNYFGHQS